MNKATLNLLTKIFNILIIGLLAFSQQASSQTKINAITSNRSALLGSAYLSEKESFVGQQCVTGKTVPAGIAQSTFNFSQTLSKKQAEDELGFSVGGKARFGAVTASAAARSMKSSVSSSYSISSVWLSEYTLPSEKLTNITFSDVGNSVRPKPDRWNETCGDMYVDEIVKGAKLFFSIRVDFSSLEAKQSFEAEFQLTGPVYSANASLKKASKEFSQDAQITITAYQIGGDVSKLTAVFGNSDTSALKFVHCSLGDFESCASVIQSAIAYASNTQTGFPSQLAPGATPGGAPLFYNLAKYSAAGISISNPILDISVKRARTKLADIFEKQLSLSVLAERLLELDMEPSAKTKIYNQQAIIESNLTKIVAASEICYNEGRDCASTVEALGLTTVDESVFILPPLPTASFRLLTTRRGIWDRDESCDSMMIRNQTDSGLYIRFRSLYEVINEGDEASVILYVEGKSLKEASVYFEDKKLLTIPLKSSSISFPDKVSQDHVAIVLETTRNYPGWQDIDLLNLKWKLIDSSGLNSGEGLFYLYVVDEFNRKTKFDLQHDNWTITEANANGQITKTERFYYYNNWWDLYSDGTNLKSTNAWTTEAKGTNTRTH